MKIANAPAAATARARGQIDEVRLLDLSQLKKGTCAWTILPVKGAAPAAVEGYAVAEWDGRRSVLVSGGVDERGHACNDVFMLQLGGTTAGGAASEWRTLQQFPSSVFDGEPFTPRSEHTMTHVSGGGSDSFSFFIFGGRGADGGLLADLWAFDMANEAWSRPESLGTPPAPRSGAACFVAARYLVVYGGLDAASHVIDTASVYDTMTSTWQTVSGVSPRAPHCTRAVARCT